MLCCVVRYALHVLCYMLLWYVIPLCNDTMSYYMCYVICCYGMLYPYVMIHVILHVLCYMLLWYVIPLCNDTCHITCVMLYVVMVCYTLCNDTCHITCVMLYVVMVCYTPM